MTADVKQDIGSYRLDCFVRSDRDLACYWVRRYASNQDDVDDIVQEALMRAASCIHKYDVRRPFRPWLEAVVINVARNSTRGFNRHRSVSMECIGDFPTPDIAPRIIEQIDARGLANDILEALSRINIPGREWIIEKFENDTYTDEEIAEVIGISLDACRARQTRIRREVRRIVTLGLLKTTIVRR